MLPCHSCYNYGTWKRKEEERLKVIIWRKAEGGAEPQTQSWGGGGAVFLVNLTSSAVPSELPSYFNLFWCKKSSMICNT